MSPFLGEFVGTALLLILGDGVVANVVLDKTKGNNSGWIVIAFGWAMAVFIGVYASNHFGGGGHLNPAAPRTPSRPEKFSSARMRGWLIVLGVVLLAAGAWRLLRTPDPARAEPAGSLRTGRSTRTQPACGSSASCGRSW